MSNIRWRSRALVTLSALGLAAGTLAVAGAPATARPVDPAPAATQAVSGANTASAEAWAAGKARYGSKTTLAQAIDAFWTPARLRAAKPIEQTAVYQDAVKKFQQSGKSAVPQPQASGVPQSFAPKSGLVKTPPSTGMNRAHNPNYPVGHPTARTSGKVFFSVPGGTAQCSATVINSEGQDTVWTAGHCVHGGAGGGWFWNWTFIPNYDTDLANPRPYGTWTAIQLWSLNGWIFGSDFTMDMGVAIMGTLGGWHIVAYLGGQGLRINFGVGQWINAFGYPAEWPFDGGHLWQCWGSNNWEVFGGSYWIPCDMTRGSSGGAWFHGWDGNWGYLYGVNSRIDRIVNPTIMLSPYFDNDALTLYNATRNL